MSSFTTHMLLGGVAGLALARGLDALGLGPLVPPLPPEAAQLLAAAMPSEAARAIGQDAALVVASAFLATLPDVDEPGSFISRRVRAAITLLGGALAAAAAWAAGLMVHLVAGAGLVGLLIGAAAGYQLVMAIRRAAGGHRRLTHSLLFAGALGGTAAGLWSWGLSAWALLPAALAWGIITHDLGDVVTPAGVPLLYPLSERDVRLLPYPLCRAGEMIGAVVALIVGAALLGIVRLTLPLGL